MEFLHKDLGHLSSGQTVSVRLSGTEANVCLLDDHNFRRYRNGDSYRGVGGHYQRSPVRISVPSSGHWHLTVDLGGYAGRIGAEVTVH